MAPSGRLPGSRPPAPARPAHAERDELPPCVTAALGTACVLRHPPHVPSSLQRTALLCREARSGAGPLRCDAEDGCPERNYCRECCAASHECAILMAYRESSWCRDEAYGDERQIDRCGREHYAFMGTWCW